MGENEKTSGIEWTASRWRLRGCVALMALGYIMVAAGWFWTFAGLLGSTSAWPGGPWAVVVCLGGLLASVGNVLRAKDVPLGRGERLLLRVAIGLSILVVFGSMVTLPFFPVATAGLTSYQVEHPVLAAIASIAAILILVAIVVVCPIVGWRLRRKLPERKVA
jgi:hypothetical protein